jgi:hypothetical protein
MVKGNVMSVSPAAGTFVTLQWQRTRARIGLGTSAARMAILALIFILLGFGA